MCMLNSDILVNDQVTDIWIVKISPLSYVNVTENVIVEIFPLSKIKVVLVNQKIVFTLVDINLTIIFILSIPNINCISKCTNTIGILCDFREERKLRVILVYMYIG